MYIEEHTLNGAETMTPFVEKLLEHLGSVCREMRKDEQDPGSMFVFPYATGNLLIDSDDGWHTVEGAYVIQDDQDADKHWFIIVASDNNFDTVLYTPIAKIDECGLTSVNVCGINVFYVEPHNVGAMVRLGPVLT